MLERRRAPNQESWWNAKDTREPDSKANIFTSAEGAQPTQGLGKHARTLSRGLLEVLFLTLDWPEFRLSFLCDWLI